MEIKRFVDENSLEHVKSFVETLASLEGVTCGETVRTIKYFIKNREEREVEEAKIKAEKAKWLQLLTGEIEEVEDAFPND